MIANHDNMEQDTRLVGASFMPGLLQSPGLQKLTGKTSQSLVKVIIKAPLSARRVHFPLACKHTQRRIVEKGEQVGSLPHPQLGMILLQRSVAPMMQAILYPPMRTYQLEESISRS